MSLQILITEFLYAFLEKHGKFTCRYPTTVTVVSLHVEDHAW